MCGPKTREIALCSIEPSEQRQDIREKKVRKREREKETEHLQRIKHNRGDVTAQGN